MTRHSPAPWELLVSLSSLPNLLGILRIIGTPVLLWCILTGTPGGYIGAFFLLLFMAVSDIVDGKLARYLKVVSPFGVFLDTTSDKIFVTAALIPLVERGLLSSWIAAVIIIRDFAVSGLRSYAAAEGLVIPAGQLGKQKLTITVTALMWLLVDAALRGFVFPAGSLYTALQWLAGLWWLSMALAVLWTIGSAVEYFYNARHLLLGRPST
jgi:CDP-diacylglycerol---glycerol-3-phosphate 3-phosphatidyltransferase